MGGMCWAPKFLFSSMLVLYALITTCLENKYFWAPPGLYTIFSVTLYFCTHWRPQEVVTVKCRKMTFGYKPSVSDFFFVKRDDADNTQRQQHIHEVKMRHHHHTKKTNTSERKRVKNTSPRRMKGIWHNMIHPNTMTMKWGKCGIPPTRDTNTSEGKTVRFSSHQNDIKKRGERRGLSSPYSGRPKMTSLGALCIKPEIDYSWGVSN